MDILTRFRVRVDAGTMNERHREVLFSDRLSDEQLWNRFCETFRFAMHYPRVTYSEFLNVYEALNLAVDQDEDFIHLVNNKWNI